MTDCESVVLQKSASRLRPTQGPSPCRMLGNLISYNQELHIIGGTPTTAYLNPDLLVTNHKSVSWFMRGEDFLMRLDSKTHRWQSESSAGLPQRAWKPWHYLTVTGQLQLLFAFPRQFGFPSLLLKSVAHQVAGRVHCFL